jgi:assimilatory nitrate reductase catalytic subunit
MKEVKTLCPYCGVGCGILAATDGSRITKVRGDPAHPANFGKLCSKGGSVAATVDSSTRLRYAMTRERRQDSLLAVSRGQAIQNVSQRLGSILQHHGPFISPDSSPPSHNISSTNSPRDISAPTMSTATAGSA